MGLQLAKVQQKYSESAIRDLTAEVSGQVLNLPNLEKLRPSDKVAITAGSRGIDSIPLVIKTVVELVKGFGGDPFIVPAMGSHGGATTEGQVRILHHLGIEEKSVGAPIRASMNVVRIGTSKSGVPVYLDEYAYQADHIISVNRIKPHTQFYGAIESGITKMLVIGLGKHKGALAVHQEAVLRNFESELLIEVAREILAIGKVWFGLGLIENERHQICHVEAVPPEDILSKEPDLLKLARKKMSSIPFEEIDLLIIDQIGKEFSGAGLDSNVIGLKTGVTVPKIKRIFIRGLSDKSEGNAIGIGRADFTTKRVVEKMDQKATYINAITSMAPDRAKIPITYDNDRQALAAAVETLGSKPIRELKVVRIKNTLELDELYVSAPLLKNKELAIIEELKPICYDETGNIAEW